MIKFYVTRIQYHRVGHIFIKFIYSLSAIRDIFKKYLIALTFSGLSENASHICRNPASASYTSVVCADISTPFSSCTLFMVKFDDNYIPFARTYPWFPQLSKHGDCKF